MIPIVLPRPKGHSTFRLVKSEEALEEVSERSFGFFGVQAFLPLLKKLLCLLGRLTSRLCHDRPALAIWEQILREVNAEIVLMVAANFECFHGLPLRSINDFVSIESAGRLFRLHSKTQLCGPQSMLEVPSATHGSSLACRFAPRSGTWAAFHLSSFDRRLPG